MPQLGNYQVGSLRSTPKLTKINGDDNCKVIWRNMGNGHAFPFIWSASVTLASGTTSTQIANGVKFHGLDLATYATVSVTPTFNAGAVYITKDTTNNIISCTVETNTTGDETGTPEGSLDILYMLGAEHVTISGVNCDGMWSSMPPTGYNS